MNGIIGMSSLLRSTKLDDEQEDFVETIRISGDSLLTIINDILDFSKIEAGRMELEEHPFNLHQMVESALDLLAQKTAEKGVELISLVEYDVPRWIVSDSTRIRPDFSKLALQRGQIYGRGGDFCPCQSGTGR